MRKFAIIPALCLLSMQLLKAQASSAKPCSAPECRQFDFWLGQWDLTWSDSLHGSNTVTKTMNGCVVQENFKDPKNKYEGMSWSVYNPQTGRWQQTWVDNTGGYIVLTGNMVAGKMILRTAEHPGKKGTTSERMTFYNISRDSFDWSWETTTDGENWTSLWNVHYKRKK